MRLALVALLAVAPLVAAQGNSTEPDVNDSDLDTSEPTPDDASLNETEAENSTASETNETDPTLDDSDFDMSDPSVDDAYLADEVATTTTGTSRVPSAGLVAALGLGGAVAAMMRRRP